MTVAEAIAEWLHEKDCRHVFGIVGAGNFKILDAISRLQKTEIVCVHHEQAAVMAASFYHRTVGRIGVALVTTGAGSTNAITGVVAAWMDSVPVLVLSGNEASKYICAPTRVLGVQGYASCEMVADVTKYAVRVQTPQSAVYQLNAALKMALAPRQGPVWVDCPKNLQSESV